MTTRSAIVLAVLGIAAAAHANVQYNGPQINGAQINGPQINGPQINGAQINGAQINGAQINGVSMNGLVLNAGSAYVGDGNFSATTNIIGHSAQCTHSEGTTGGALTSSCSPCAQRVCSYDSYCCTTSWDSICTSEANNERQCTAYPVTGANLVGTWFPSTVYNADNTTRTVWVWIAGTRVTANGFRAYNVNYWTDAYYDTLGNYHAGTWYNSLCPSNSKDSVYGTGSNHYNEALLISGVWESRTGSNLTSRFNSQSYYGGGKIPGSPAGSFSFACRDVGALAKCLERDHISDTRSGNTYGACVRMTRADFCGNGLSFTQDGVQLDVSDVWSGQTLNTSGSYVWEAYWSAKGATAIQTGMVQATRVAAPTSPYGSIDFVSFYYQYGATQCQYTNGDAGAGTLRLSTDPTLVTDQIVYTP